MALKEIQFFGKVDRTSRDGHITSEYPAWYHVRRMEMMKEEIETDRFRLNNGKNSGIIPFENYQREMNLLSLKEIRLKEIYSSQPIIKGKDKDEAKKLYDSVAEGLKGVKPSKTDMMKGLANPHDQNTRNTVPCVKVEEIEGLPQICANLGVKLGKDNKLTEKDADKMYRILGKALGENSDSESLRKRDDYGTFRTDIPWKDLVAMTSGK